MAPHWAPQRDVRDMANLSARLVDLSFTFAKFLRYQVHDHSLCADELLGDLEPRIR